MTTTDVTRIAENLLIEIDAILENWSLLDYHNNNIYLVGEEGIALRRRIQENFLSPLGNYCANARDHALAITHGFSTDRHIRDLLDRSESQLWIPILTDVDQADELGAPQIVEIAENLSDQSHTIIRLLNELREYTQTADASEGTS